MLGETSLSPESPSRRESRKRRRVSERRRVFGKLAGQTTDNNEASGSFGDSSTRSSRSDSPLNYGGGDKIPMKIQFHITVAPDNEPLILDVANTSLSGSPGAANGNSHPLQRLKSAESTSIGDQIHEKLSRQNTLSTRRRNQLLALHNQPAMEPPATGVAEPHNGILRASLPDHRLLGESQEGVAALGSGSAAAGREQGARSSTITGGMSDEATARFLERHHSQRRQSLSLEPASSTPASQPEPVAPPIPAHQREHIFFKRDGQRFGHEFTLKLAVDKTYRCLLKVRPLIPLQAISIQGHHVPLVDCSHRASAAASSSGRRATAASVSAPSSSLALTSRSNWQVDGSSNRSSHSHHNHRHLSHAQTLGASKLSLGLSRQELLYQQQQSQMLRYFAGSHCATSHSHSGGQLVYMFDWSAGRFEVNKNKARTQVNAVLRFKNGQILSLPLQIKFYEQERRQHLNWGNQLHFIDFDCSINSLGQISVDRVQYY